MNSTDFLRLKEHKIFKETCESLPKNITKTLDLLVVHDNILFSWDFQINCVLSLNLKAARSKEGDNVIHQKLLPLHPPLFSAEFLIINDIGTLLAVAGSSGILVLELLPRCPPYGAFDNNKEVVYCTTHSLDERLLSCNEMIELRQAKFHPGSINHNHILVLTSDNMLRLYQIKNGEALKVAVYTVGEKPTSLFPGTKTPFLDLYGEVAVDFDFGQPQIIDILEQNEKSLKHPKVEEKYINAETQTIERIVPKTFEKPKIEKDEYNLVWPVFILHSNMNIYYMEIDLQRQWKPVLQGPLPLISFENEQVEACSLICLNTQPQIVCIAISDGTLCHSILLDDTNEFQNNITQKTSKQLLAFESVELELGLTISECIGNKFKCPIILKKDESKSDRYYATHNAGAHSVTLSCINDLHAFLNVPEDLISIDDIFLNSSKAEYLVCTKTATSENSNPVIGFALYYEPPSIITLLSDGSVVTLGVLLGSSLPNVEDIILEEDVTSPLKKMLQEPFEKYIENILKKTSTQPILKLPNVNENNQENCYELLQRTAQVFRDEYFKNHIKAKEELEKRIQTLSMMKRNQLKEIEHMRKERDVLREKASNLAEKYEDIQDKQDELLKRSENLLMLVSRKKSSPSEAEQAFVKELENYGEKIGLYGDKIDRIKNKMKYQQIQMENWKLQEIKKISTINETHTNTIKTNLQETTQKITEMIKQINSFKKNLDLK
ncbi:nuclear pore complex protein Nup88 [Diorhabda sublineata]|uniref:nuclear pore complex protein Nup88 n=1 Tax=Diorhabda sublineata TaxID=1163346 RepID=UPI0024E04C9E|nr:nuclear pore complex protein Nup88 [Diorhabda sublineata]